MKTTIDPLRMPVRGRKIDRLKILVVQFRSLGDAVVSIPALMAIRKRFPDCELHALVTDTAAPLLQHHPVLNKVWAIPRVRGKARVAQTWPLLQALRAEHFDRSVDIGNNDRSELISFFCGARERLGFSGSSGFFGRRFCYTQTVPQASRDQHESLRILHILAPWKISPPSVPEIKLFTDPALPNPFQRDPSRQIVFCLMGGGCAKKLWPVAHWAKLHRLATLSGYELFFTRGTFPGEEQMIRELQILVPEVQLLPLFDLPRLLVVLKSCDAVISNDTGPMHFAAGLGVKTIGLFGPSSVTRWTPLGAEVRILKTQGCVCEFGTQNCRRTNHCMAEITPEAVFQSLESLLPKSPSPRPVSADTFSNAGEISPTGADERQAGLRL